VVQLFGHLVDKDLFIEIYRNYLAKRLLNEKSESLALEKGVITNIKLNCGPQFTKRMEGMINDLSMAQEEIKKFNAYAEEKKLLPTNLEFNVQVITRSYWPSYKNMEVSIPRELETCMKVFQDYYQSSYQHRQITWCFSHGNATVASRFSDKQYNLVTTTYQMCILVLFNSRSTLSFEEIKSSMQFDDETAKKNLSSLMTNNAKILEKVNPTGTKQITSEDAFQVNEAFISQLKKVVLPIPITEEVYKKEKVQEDRSIAIEAAIVRIMKSRKRLSHNELMQEVIANLQFFKPHPKQIKMRIECLIDREYLERDADDKAFYKYLA